EPADDVPAVRTGGVQLQISALGDGVADAGQEGPRSQVQVNETLSHRPLVGSRPGAPGLRGQGRDDFMCSAAHLRELRLDACELWRNAHQSFNSPTCRSTLA